jgi:alkaline phosphatase
MKEKGFRIANSKKETLNAVGGPHRLAALLHPNNMPGIIDEKPRKMSLAEMTQQALTHLESQQANGFFLMVEGSQIDWEKHNMSGHGTIDETRDFDRAVETALDYARDRQDTLVVVTSDHDTAGMAITSPDIANAYLDKMGGTEEARKELAPRSALEPDDGPKSSAAPKPVESFKLGSSRPSKTEIRNAEYTFGPDLAQDKRIFTAFSYLPVASYAYRDKDTSFYAPHTPNFTPIFSEGPDSSFIAGASDNAELGEKLKSLIRDADPEVSSPQNNNTNKPENTIVVLAEGLGLPPVAATMYAEGPLAIRNFSVKGLSSTHSRDNLVSDKAAAATAIATGEKTRNGALSTSEGPKPHILPTLLESAEETGKSTALITTRKWRHVVPASFFAHSPHCPKEIGCGPETDLLEQFADMQNRYEESDGIDVSISFGVNKLEGNQRSLLRKRGYSIRDTWRDDNLPTTGKIMQFVNSGASLEHVTKATLERLSEEEKGFVALIHDHRLAVPQKNVKTNDSLIEQMLQFDRVIQEIASFAENHRDTAVIVTSLDNYTTSIQDNHYAFAKGMCGIAKQCGGPERFRRFKVSTKNIDRASGFDATELQGGFTPPNVFIQYSWIIQEVGKRLEKEPKSANFVPVWASGPGTDKFEGFQQQFEIGQKLKSIIRP